MATCARPGADDEETKWTQGFSIVRDPAAVGSPPGACGFGEVHAAARSATAIVSAARNDSAGPPRLVLLRARSSDILSSYYLPVSTSAATTPERPRSDPARATVR